MIIKGSYNWFSYIIFTYLLEITQIKEKKAKTVLNVTQTLCCVIHHSSRTDVPVFDFDLLYWCSCYATRHNWHRLTIIFTSKSSDWANCCSWTMKEGSCGSGVEPASCHRKVTGLDLQSFVYFLLFLLRCPVPSCCMFVSLCQCYVPADHQVPVLSWSSPQVFASSLWNHPL